MDIQKIYEKLREAGFCKTQADFSREWLGRSEGYLAYLRSARAQPSITSVSLLLEKLKKIVEMQELRHGDHYHEIIGCALGAQLLFSSLDHQRICRRIGHLNNEYSELRL